MNLGASVARARAERETADLDTRSQSSRAPETVAAVDLGSNSFHMVVARVTHGELHVVDRIRDRVALAEGLDDDRVLTPEATQRGLDCLSRFGQRLRDFPAGTVRAVGTSALRQARNGRAFLKAGRDALGFPIEVISGLEEARLIYLGVSQSTPADVGPHRLVIDIGGGSTEAILGEGFDPLITDSLRMGCVGFTRKFFADGKITRERMRRARLAARLEVQTIERAYTTAGWDHCAGSSGTICAVEGLLLANGWSEDAITAKGLRRLRKAMVSAGHWKDLELEELAEDRAPVLAGGVAILSAIVDGLGIQRMKASRGALREGLLYDLLGRIRHEDVRDRTMRMLSQRYHVDQAHALSVERTARDLLAGVASDWELDEPDYGQVLSWAARLHEIGQSISYSGHHKHGAYLARNADMPGFSRADQELLAAMILNQRRRPRLESFETVPAPKPMRRLCVLLRLAVLLNRSRGAHALPMPGLTSSQDGQLELAFEDGWLEEHPLTRADLEGERVRLEEFGVELAFR